ncbi:5-oxoprolinase subunit PxpB [Halalkalibacter alkalisediminis]|uniref:5-oxoprolinase subunit PxpB n=1 Tax=Halalkalibacter alkalisediminis TaxID=935616 RepID=A0ABV6NIK4_9BACI|nr:5-oxoprolinase subunit PxpB [Halalkalibacter alkalisediminis]
MRSIVAKENLGFDIHPLGDMAIMVTLGTSIDISIHRKLKTFTTYLDNHPFEGMIEYVPAFTSVTVYYDPVRVLEIEKQKGSAYEIVYSKMKQIVLSLEDSVEETKREIEIPVYYGGELGPDLEFVAKHNNLTTDEVIHIHSEGEYLVYMIGFAPGFPYLGGMSEQISAPRRSNPRMNIMKGSVGIAGKQTGVYSISTPGGWQIIGRTPLKFFRPSDNPPSLLRSGDVIRFKPISMEVFRNYKEDS